MNAKRRTVLIVEDDAVVSDVVARGFEAEGFACRCVHGGTGVLDEVRRDPPDLILMDRMLPGVSGDELVRRLRADDTLAAIPIIMLTGKAEESDELVGLALGADDYIAKPFSLKRLVARAEVVLRRAGVAAAAAALDAPNDSIHLFGIDRETRRVRIDDRSVPLSAVEYRLLGALMAAGGGVIDKQRLFQIAHETRGAVSVDSIDADIRTLRSKLGKAATLIHEVPGAGYAFCPPASAES